MPAAADRGLFTIPPWRPFADDLAAGLLRLVPDPLQLARTLLLLPSRRAVRAVQEAFLREADGKALLLPRMVAIGDLDDDESDTGGDTGGATGGAPLDAGSEAAEPPAISALSRQLALARLLLAAPGRQAAEAMNLARQLGVALDLLEIEGKSAADLDGAVPEGLLQQHWERNAAVLALIQQQWPALLRERGRQDAARRRNRVLQALEECWRQAPPPHPVVLAGFAAAPPAVAALARRVSRLSGGCVVLPGFDSAMEDSLWALLAGDAESAGLETHAQHGMVALLQAMGRRAGDVAEWPWAGSRSGSAPERAALVRRAMQPAAFAGGPAGAADERALSGVQMAEAANPAAEALLIAVAMRQLLQHPGKTAALVTADRALARRVAVQLKRFSVAIDDSAGQSLAATGPGSLLLALATAADERFAPVPLLALLQHPLVMAGDERLPWLGRVRALDLGALRGVRPGPGLAGLSRRLRRPGKTAANAAGSAALGPALAGWWEERARPLLAPLDPPPGDGAALIEALVHCAEALAGESLWAGIAGRALSRLLSDLAADGSALARLPVRTGGLAPFLATLLAPIVVRPQASLHPRLHIWGLLEARLQTADLLILGGLNEASWPGLPAPDPFLAPAIRRALRLPGLMRRIGLQGQDFAAALGAPDVLLTRARREKGAPTVPSRFWQRLAAETGGLPDKGRLLPSRAALLQAVATLDHADAAPPLARPAPAPPVAARPRAIRVTDVAMLKADPFSFYGKRVLNLRALDPRDMEPTAALRGQVVHSALERIVRERAVTAERRCAILDEEARKLGDRPDLAALWRPRALRMIEWVAATLRAGPEWRPVAIEEEARMEVAGVSLIGRIDRLDRSGDSLRVVDYKTGTPPKVKDVTGLYQTQLALLAHMANAGLFPGTAGARVEAAEYWRLQGGANEGEIRPALGSKAGRDELAAHVEAAWRDLEELVGRYLLRPEPFEAKVLMAFRRQYGDYDHLARVAEWLGR